MLTLQDRLDQLINDARIEFFTHDAVKNGLVNDENVLGVLISTHFEWDGRACFETLQAALEDSNFHKVNKALGETWKTIEGASHE
jgi:hypothetical protein